MPAVAPADAEIVIGDLVKALIDSDTLPAPTQGQAWRRLTDIPAGVTPTWTVQVRAVAGESDQAVAHRATVDVRLWADGTLATKELASRSSRILFARLRQRAACRVLAAPVVLPDPADATKQLVLFTIQPLLRGEQL